MYLLYKNRICKIYILLCYCVRGLKLFDTFARLFEHIQILFDRVQQFLIGILIRSYIKRLETSLTFVLLNFQTHIRKRNALEKFCRK